MMSDPAFSAPAVPATAKIPEQQNRFVVSIVTVLGAQIGRALISLLLEVIYARLLGPAGRGQLSLSMMVFSCGILVGGMGGEIPIMIWSADRTQSPVEWLPSVIFCGLLGSVFASALWVFLFWYWQPAFLRGITPPLALLLLGSIPFGILGTYCLAFLVGLDRLRDRSIMVVLSQLVNLAAAGMLFYFLGPSVERAFVALMAGLIAALISAAVFLKPHLRLLSDSKNIAWLGKAGPTLRLGIRGQLGNVATFFNYRLDVFIVNYYLNTTEVGLYALGVMISEALWQVPNAAALSLVPRTARNLDDSGVQFTCLVCRQVFVVACLMALSVALLCAWLVPLVFGEKFGPSVPVIWWILPGTVALAVAKVMCADLLARGMPGYAALFSFVSLLVTVTFDLILIPRMGIQGAALASTLAYLANSFLVAFVLRRKLGVSWAALYLPTRTELDPYLRAWGRLMSWVRPSSVVV